MARAAGGADLANNGEDDVLRRHALRQRTVDLDEHVLRLGLDQRLGGEHVLDFGGADAVGERAEGAMGRGVAVTAHDRHAGQGKALLRADDVDDALAAVGGVVIFDAEIGGVPGQRLDLDAAFLVLDAVHPVGGRRHVVVDDGEGALGLADLAVGQAQALEGLRAGDLVNEMAVDIEEAGAVLLLGDEMLVPDLVVEGARFGLAHGSVLLRRALRSGRSVHG